MGNVLKERQLVLPLRATADESITSKGPISITVEKVRDLTRLRRYPEAHVLEPGYDGLYRRSVLKNNDDSRRGFEFVEQKNRKAAVVSPDAYFDEDSVACQGVNVEAKARIDGGVVLRKGVQVGAGSHVLSGLDIPEGKRISANTTEYGGKRPKTGPN